MIHRRMWQTIEMGYDNITTNNFRIKSKYSVSYLRNHGRVSQVPQRQNYLLSYIKRELIAAKVVESGFFSALSISWNLVVLLPYPQVIVNPVMPVQFVAYFAWLVTTSKCTNYLKPQENRSTQITLCMHNYLTWKSTCGNPLTAQKTRVQPCAVFPTQAFHFGSQAHTAYLSETEFQPVIIPSSNRDTGSNEMSPPEWHQYLFMDINNVLMSANHKFSR